MMTRNPNQVWAGIRQVVGSALRRWSGRALLGVIVGGGALVTGGAAQAQFQGVQPIFNNQLGG